MKTERRKHNESHRMEGMKKNEREKSKVNLKNKWTKKWTKYNESERRKQNERVRMKELKKEGKIKKCLE